ASSARWRGIPPVSDGSSGSGVTSRRRMRAAQGSPASLTLVRKMSHRIRWRSFRARTRRRLAQELASDHHALDLVGALVDLRDLGVAHHPLERVVAAVAVAAED